MYVQPSFSYDRKCVRSAFIRNATGYISLRSCINRGIFYSAHISTLYITEATYCHRTVLHITHTYSLHKIVVMHHNQMVHYKRTNNVTRPAVLRHRYPSGEISYKQPPFLVPPPSVERCLYALPIAPHHSSS